MEEIYIQNVMHNLKELEIAKEKLNLQIKECEESLKNYMQLCGLEELHGCSGEKAIYKEIIGKRFDTKEFKKRFEGLYNSYLKNTRNLRFKFSY